MEKNLDERSFGEILVEAAHDKRYDMVGSLLHAYQEGDPGAIKLVSQYMAEARFLEDNNFPITDERFKQIINLASDAIREGSF